MLPDVGCVGSVTCCERDRSWVSSNRSLALAGSLCPVTLLLSQLMSPQLKSPPTMMFGKERFACRANMSCSDDRKPSKFSWLDLGAR